MKSNPLLLVVDNQEVFDLVDPILNKTFNTTQVVHCNNHQNAMNFVASDQRADIIFADWSMTGYDFLDSVRKDLVNNNTPVIIMSEDTNNKQIVLNNIESKATFFLAKPFLKKGFIKKLSKVLNLIEHRRKNRLHPSKAYNLKIELNKKQSSPLPLIDISIDGCLLRVPVETSKRFSIYQKTVVLLAIDEFNIQINGEIYRIGHDIPIPEHHDSVLIMVKFTDPQQNIELQDVIDELGKRWPSR